MLERQNELPRSAERHQKHRFCWQIELLVVTAGPVLVWELKPGIGCCARPGVWRPAAVLREQRDAGEASGPSDVHQATGGKAGEGLRNRRFSRTLFGRRIQPEGADPRMC